MAEYVVFVDRYGSRICAKESQLSLKGGMMELKKDGTCNTIIALLGAGKENCYRPERPIQVPLFDESGENVEDKRKREKASATPRSRALEKEIKSLKEANNPIKRLTDLFGRILEE